MKVFSRLSFGLFVMMGLIPTHGLSKAPLPTLVKEGMDKVQTEFSSIRLSPDDLQLPKGWPLPFTIEAVESFFNQPLSIPEKATLWGDRVEYSTGIRNLFNVGYEILKGPDSIDLPSSPPVHNGNFPPHFPPNWKSPLANILAHLMAAQTHLDKAVASISENDRTNLLGLYEWPQKSGKVVQEISSRRIQKKYDAMKSFQQKDLLKAGHLIVDGLDDQLSTFQKLAPQLKERELRWTTPLGDVVLAGPGDDVYKANDLENVVLLIDGGGNNSYYTSMAAGLPGKIQIVIDFGEEVTIPKSENVGPNAGVGIFGVGILILPNPKGTKIIHTHSFGAGCGIGGIGILLASGQVEIQGLRYVQGAGVFGLGLLQTSHSHDSSFIAERNGQGLGMARGVGIFSHQGNNSKIFGGLVQPDPREPQGSVSLCQGVGFGRRAYTGGGVGIAVISGDNNTVKGSYFAQGCGYWHGFGLFRYRGDHSTLQARRYDLGSGIHSAFGHFQLFGDDNRILNWGVGPAFGWDAGVGSAFIHGSNNEFQGSWGTGTASIGSLSYSFIKGNNNKLNLRGYGNGQYERRRLSFSAHVIEGTGNVTQNPISHNNFPYAVRTMQSPWGVLRYSSIKTRKDLKLVPPVWEKLPQEAALQRDRLDLRGNIKEALTKTSLVKVDDLVDVASAFSIDKTSPRQALGHLLSLGNDSVPSLVDVVNPAATDQLITLRVVLPAYGNFVTKKIISSFNDYSLEKKTVLLSQLSFHPPHKVRPFALNLIRNPHPSPETASLRVAAIQALGLLLNKDSGKEPGFRALLISLEESAKNPTNKKARMALQKNLERIRPWEAFALLSTTMDLDTSGRQTFFNALPEEKTDLIKEKGARTATQLFLSTPTFTYNKVQNTLQLLDQLENEIRSDLYTMLKSTRTNEVKVAIKILGQISHPEDLEKIIPFYSSDSGIIREMTAIALGRLGKAAIPFLIEQMKSESVRDRQLAMATIPHAVSKKSLALLKLGLKDPHPDVNLTAISAINVLPPVLTPYQKKLVKQIRKKSHQKNTPPEIKFAAETL